MVVHLVDLLIRGFQKLIQNVVYLVTIFGLFNMHDTWFVFKERLK